MKAYPYAESKARLVSEIERMKAAPDSEVQLRAALATVMAGWGGMVKEFGKAHAFIDHVAEKVGIDHSSQLADVVEFPNWVVHQFRLALGDVHE